MSALPDFDAFYRAVNNGRDPFPWQRRLAGLAMDGTWPAEIGVPTGLGKTGCIDIAVWALAAQAHRASADRTAPTRTWYVVNRRLLVDAAYDRGCRIAAVLAHPESVRADCGEPAVEVVAAIAEALRSLAGGAGDRPLEVSRLRGGAEQGARAPDPSHPTVVFATVPMFASRLLFRGYGTSTQMRPVDAALAGMDCLVLLDEAHLARPLQRLLGPLAECDIGDPANVLAAGRSRPLMVSLTATGEGGPSRFDLDDADFAHPVVRTRLEATKPLRLIQTTEKGLVGSLVESTVELLSDRAPAAAVVFVNTPKVAREVFVALQRPSVIKQLAAPELQLLTGRMRDREADAVRGGLLDPATGAPAGFQRAGRSKHLVVVATQTLEVGADLDFDVLVTEACGARALVQRLGRLNRLGLSEEARGAVVLPEDAKAFPVYGEEVRRVWTRLSAVATNKLVALTTENTQEIVGAPEDQPPRTGELLPAHVWEWVKTSQAPPGEAPPELFFEGFATDQATLTIAWRANLPVPGLPVRPPVVAAETVEVPIGEARAVLASLVGDEVHRLAGDLRTLEIAAISAVRPGDTVIVPADRGGYDAHGWAPESSDPVLDVSLFRAPGLPLTDETWQALLQSGEPQRDVMALSRALAQPPEPDDATDRGHVAAELIAALTGAAPVDPIVVEEWDDLLHRIQPRPEYAVDDFPRLVLAPPAKHATEVLLRSDVFDELSLTTTSVALWDHLDAVGAITRNIAGKLGLPPRLVDAVALAAGLHDIGKVDERFQRWLDPSLTAEQPVAKSDDPPHLWERNRRAAGWPGGRHEELSRRLVAAWFSQVDAQPVVDVDLVEHLVVTHHGYGRPLIPAVVDEAPPALVAEIEGTRVVESGDLSEIDWTQPARFRKCCERYGYWGLALLEAIVRQADHQASAAVAI